MILSSAFFAVNLVCAWFQCEYSFQPPYFRPGRANPFPVERKPPPIGRTREGRSFFKTGEETLVVKTEAGFIQGFRMMVNDSRRIFAFTGVPYGDLPERFADPKMRSPWEGVWKATSPSPYCIQLTPATLPMASGEEDCLFLDIYTPTLDTKRRLPVIIWIPAGSFIFGRSRQYGPAKFLREDVILVVINVRMGLLGFAATGDDVAPGNWGIRDQLLAVEWVYSNVKQFGGDPKRIVIGGISSGGAAAGLTLFANHPAKKIISGVISLSGVPFINYSFDSLSRVKNFTELVAARVGCPARTGSVKNSRTMIECLRRVNPYTLANQDGLAMITVPPIGLLAGPTLEPHSNTSLFPEIPDVLYKEGKVPPIPWIMSRGEGESQWIAVLAKMISPFIISQYKTFLPKILPLASPQSLPGTMPPDERIVHKNIDKVGQLYFNGKGNPWRIGNLKKYMNLISDSLYASPNWRGVNFHHKLAPTYVFLNLHSALDINPLINLIALPLLGTGSPHAADFVFFFNMSNVNKPVGGGDAEVASQKMINMFVNFAAYGKPLYRFPSGKLENVWKPVESMKAPVYLEVGLVRDFKMVVEPLVNSRRYRIWEDLKF